MEAQIEKIQDIFNKELEELKNKQTEMNNRITEMKNTLEGINRRFQRQKRTVLITFVHKEKPAFLHRAGKALFCALYESTLVNNANRT